MLTSRRQTRLACIGAAILGICGGPLVAQPPAQLPPPPASSSAEASRPLTITDILAMQQAGLDDGVIIQSVRQHGMASTLGSAELISMRQYGISNAVIQEMQTAGPRVVQQPSTVVRQTVVQQQPVIVEPVRVYSPPPVIVAPPYYYPHYRYHHYPVSRHHGHHSHSHSSFGIRINF